MPITRQPQLAAPGAAQAPEGCERVVGDDTAPVPGPARSPAPVRPPAAPGAGVERLAREARRRRRARPRRPTKRSPGRPRASRPPRARPARRAASPTSRRPRASATRSASASITRRRRPAQRFARDGHVVERHLAPALELLALLVALAGDDHHVAGVARSRRRARSRRGGPARPRLPRAGCRQHLLDDRLGVLGARVVGGDDHAVGQPRRGARPSAGAWRGRGRRPRRTRTMHARPPASLARGAQHVLQRVGRVGVVDEHREMLALVDRLEAAGHAAGRRRAPRRSWPRLDAQRAAAAIAPSAFGTLKRPGSGGDLAAGRPASRRRTRQPAGSSARRGPGSRRRDRSRRSDAPSTSPASRRPYRSSTFDHARGPRSALEQPALGREVVLHRRVEVEVVLGEVGEDAAAKWIAVGAVQLERVRGDLHRARPVARVEHRPERRLQVDRLGRRALDRRPRARRPRDPTVPSSPVRMPAASSSARTRKAVVVLPFVPVMPTTRSSAVGLP